MENKYIQVHSTVKNIKEAEEIAKILVDKKLAACVQIVGPIKSIYKWKGKLEKSREYLCLIKSASSKKERIIREIKKVHSYKVPEIVVVPIIGGSPDYLEWLRKETEIV